MRRKAEYNNWPWVKTKLRSFKNWGGTRMIWSANAVAVTFVPHHENIVGVSCSHSQTWEHMVFQVTLGISNENLFTQSRPTFTVYIYIFIPASVFVYMYIFIIYICECAKHTTGVSRIDDFCFSFQELREGSTPKNPTSTPSKVSLSLFLYEIKPKPNIKRSHVP